MFGNKQGLGRHIVRQHDLAHVPTHIALKVFLGDFVVEVAHPFRLHELVLLGIDRLSRLLIAFGGKPTFSLDRSWGRSLPFVRHRNPFHVKNMGTVDPLISLLNNLLNTLLDKGVLALLALLAGFKLNQTLEGTKSNLLRQQEHIRTINTAVVELTKKLRLRAIAYLGFLGLQPKQIVYLIKKISKNTTKKFVLF